MAEPARLGKTDRLKVGDPVYAVDAPQGLELSLSEGIISQLRGGHPHPIIQTTVAISPGSSGGGLFTAKGELVGITTFYLKDGQSLNFALPVEWADQEWWEIVDDKAPVGPGPGARPKEGWEKRTVALSVARDKQGLLDCTSRWVRAEPGNPVAWYWLGGAYGDLGSHAEAIEAYREALRLKPDYVLAWNNLAITYDQSGNRGAALEAVQQLRRSDPQKAESLYNQITGQ